MRDKDGHLHDVECIHGGVKFIWPTMQQYEFLDINPITVNVEIENAQNKQNTLVNFSAVFSVAISVERETMKNAANNLLGLDTAAIKKLSQDLITGQLLLVIAGMDTDEINTDRDKFLTEAANTIENELKRIGLSIVNVNINDIVCHDRNLSGKI